VGRIADHLLVDAAQAGATEAFDKLVVRYHAQVVRVAYRVTRDEHEAHDIAQDAFLRAYRGLGEFDSGRPFATWILLIARNAAIDSLRRQRRSTAFVSEKTWPRNDFVNPEDLALKNEEATLVRTAIASLPERYRLAVELYYLRDMCYTDIATALDVPISTVKTFLFRAKSRLRTNVSEADPN